MLKQNIKSSLKKLFKNKLYTIINISGLSLSFAVAILILLYVNSELNVDKHHENYKQIYRLYNKSTNSAFGAATFGEYLSGNNPEFKNFTRYIKFYGTFQYSGNKSILIENPAFVDSTFLDIFSINIIKRNKEKLLCSEQSILISESIAQKMFGDSDPLNQVIRFDNRYDYIVEGVYEDYPSNSSFSHDVIGSFPSIKKFWGYPDFNVLEDDNTLAFATYFLLSKNVEIRELNEKIQSAFAEKKGELEFELQNMHDVYFNTNVFGPGTNQGNKPIVYLFLTISIIIIVIAMINYINLSTSVSTKSALSIGVRKTLGSNRSRLIVQFIIETIILCITSLFIGFILSELLITIFNNSLQASLQVKTFYQFPYNIISIVVAIIIAILSGIYPALYLTKLKPVEVMKGKFDKTKGISFFKKGLMIFQFIVTIILISATIVVYKQLNYWRSMDLGIAKDNIITFSLRAEVGKNADAFREQVLQIPSVEAVCFGSGTPGNVGSSFSTDVDERTVRFNRLEVDADYFDLFEIEIIEGEGFSKENADANSNKYLLNETALKQLGWDDVFERDWEGYKCIGIVKDFIYGAQKGPIEPLFISFAEKEMFINIKMSSNGIPETMKSIEKVWTGMTSNFPFIYRFIDDVFDFYYKTEERLTKLLSYFAVFSIFIACLGLFGLISFMAEQRTKEIGVRKANGANIKNIILLFSKEFIQLVLISGVIAVPVSYFVLAKWLQNYTYSTNLSWWIFALSISIAVIVSSVSVAYKALRAASQNPVDALRYE